MLLTRYNNEVWNLHKKGFLMKTIEYILLTTIPNFAFGQYESTFLPEFFFGRQPSARAEAMGKAYVSIDGDLSSVYFNPAGIASIKAWAIINSYTPPNYYLTKGHYNFYGLSFGIGKKLQIAISKYQFNYGKTPIININKIPYTENNTLTISSEIIKNLFVGLNTNYFVWEPGINKLNKSIYIDFGLIKKMKLSESESNQQAINLGASISNSNYGKTTNTSGGITSEYKLPVITKYGLSYNFSFNKPYIIDSLKFLTIMAQFEYQMLINSAYRDAVRVGGEITFCELLSLRVGYYKEKVYNYGLPDDNKSEIQSITYGLGVQIPLYLLTKMPFNINFDYTSLPQPNYSMNLKGLTNFNSYTLGLKIFIRKKNALIQ